jgi:hypothetical protein
LAIPQPINSALPSWPTGGSFCQFHPCPHPCKIPQINRLNHPPPPRTLRPHVRRRSTHARKLFHP